MATATVTAPASPSATPTLSASPAPPASATAGLPDGDLIIDEAGVMPLPIMGKGPRPSLHFKLRGRALGLRWKLYTRNMVAVGKSEQLLALNPGWNRLGLDLPADLPSDVYYLELKATRDGSSSPSKLVKLMVLR